MNKTINKPSITKKQVWSLILEIKSIFSNLKNHQKTLSVSKKINNDNLRLFYFHSREENPINILAIKIRDCSITILLLRFINSP